jgi:hypothetical protein
VRKRGRGPDLGKAAALALLYWEVARGVEWVDRGRLRRRARGEKREPWSGGIRWSS